MLVMMQSISACNAKESPLLLFIYVEITSGVFSRHSSVVAINDWEPLPTSFASNRMSMARGVVGV
jgi:hypothetical protein